jgi:hypothetical protein
VPPRSAATFVRIVLLNIFVTRRRECADPVFSNDQRRDAHHHIDDRLGSQTVDSRAPDMLDHRSTSREHLREEPTFILESARPFRIVWHQQHVVHHSTCSIRVAGPGIA